MRLDRLLLELKLITQEQLKKAQEVTNEKGMRLGETLVSLGYITEEQLMKALAQELKMPYIDLSKIEIDPEACRLVNERLVRKHHLIPVETSANKLVIAMANPLDILAIEDVRIFAGKTLQIGVASKSEIDAAIANFYSSSEEVEKAITELGQGSDIFSEEEAEESADVSNAPIVRLVKSIITDAIKTRTSDIHIEPFEKRVRVRYRIDGELKEVLTLERRMHAAIVSRVKLIGGMDIAERRIPQDGRVETVIEGRAVDMRISVLPAVYGEKIVIRLLDRSSIVVTKEQLGFTQINLELFDRIIRAPEGMILLTGPTGSGKTTTLYAVLKELNSINKNIITLEDPVEYRLDGVNQVQVNVKAGMTFASGLRSILRQDPDIVMLGEIRDQETAQIAVRAAITGHVVLSTLHTNDTASTISRLVDMGIETFMVSSAVVGVVAQRLIRKICPKCKASYIPNLNEMMVLEMEKPQYLYRGAGCNYCGGSGYAGRTAIHEILVMDREIRGMINRGESIDKIKDAARSRRMQTLNESARELVLRGVTTIEQMLKITYSIDS